MLVNGLDAWLETPGGSFPLSTQRYAPDVCHPDARPVIESFAHEPWPTWTLRLPDGTRVVHEVLVHRRTAATLIRWTVTAGAGRAVLRVRPFFSGRDYHATHHENGAFGLAPERRGPTVRFFPYPGLPAVSLIADGEYGHAPHWYRNFLYAAERERGLDDVEDLASPGELRWQLDETSSSATLWLVADDSHDLKPDTAEQVRVAARTALDEERRRRAAFPTTLDRAADSYIVSRGGGRTIVAGYPWFTDWGRDAFIAIRGLCLATGRDTDARDILLEWAGAVSEGMLPNRFPDNGEAPEFNSVDASLWYVVAVGALQDRTSELPRLLTRVQRKALDDSVRQIVSGYAAGTRFGIRMDADGLLAAGVPGVQLTWMDARVGDRVITPRIGKPVEVQALWVNALAVAARTDPRWSPVLDRARAAFGQRFWVERLGCLADVVDVDHQAGVVDETIRPNQILAVGGLPVSLLGPAHARRVVEVVERELLTPIGLRSLGAGEPGFAPRYAGGPAERDAVYHQGTVWPWLLGAFVEAWLRVHGNTVATREQARARFLGPLFDHLETSGLGHVSEITDATAPFLPRGCPFQAWSLGELLRLDRQVLGATRPTLPARQLQPA